MKHLFFTLLSELAREVWECKELPNYFTLGPEKFLLAGTDGKKFLKKFRE